MDSFPAAPPAYAASGTPNDHDEAPPPFEPGPSAPVIPTDTKLPFYIDNDTAPVTLPRRTRAPSSSSTSTPTPTAFEIGSKVISMFELVSIPEIRAHLAFLGAFARLKVTVKSQKGPDVHGSVDKLWATYLARAVDRFAKWIDRGLGDFDANVWDGATPRDMMEEEVPPLDVLMVWHTYMLNPRVYYEDGMRRKSRLLNIRAFPLHLIDGIVDIDTHLPIDPSTERQRRFESLTGQTWFAPLNTTMSDTTMVSCPRCEDKTLVEVCWVTNEKTGFAERAFRAQCHVCMQIFNQNKMIVRALCDDIITVRASLDDKSSAPKIFISGTLLNWKTGQPDIKGAIRSNEVLLVRFFDDQFTNITRGSWLAGALNYSIGAMENALGLGLEMSGGQQQVTRILSHYRSPSYPFSIELCGAILRQGSFIDKMVNLGWTEPRTFDDDLAVPTRCIARYNAWLNIMEKFPKQMLVPTLDIDLVWHTHQLKQAAYRTQTLTLLRKFVDHDDKIEDNRLSDAYDQTAKLWQQRYGIPYHVCGCIHPPTSMSITTPVASLSKMFRGKGKTQEFVNSRPQLTSTHDCEAPVTHPSEHNAVLVYGHKLTEERRESRIKAHEKWDKQTRTTVEKGKVPEDGWEATSVRRAEGHSQAFMRPIPNPSLTPVIPFGAESCAAHDGGVLDGRRLNEQPTDGKYSAGMCAPGMGLYGMLPLGGFNIGAMGACSGACSVGGNGGAYGGGGCGGCGG